MVKIRLDTKSEQSILNMLLDNEAINSSQLSKINSTSSEVGKTKIETAIELNLTNEEKISKLLANSYSLETVDLNQKKIDEKLKKIQNKKIQEYLISEILFTITEEDKLDSEIAEMIKKINIEGFENVARNSSISESGIKGGDLGWLNENVISEKMKSTILETPVGQLSKPVVLRNGVLIFKIRDRREVKESLSLEQSKNILVNSEKTKILKMHSASHFDRVRRTITVKFF